MKKQHRVMSEEHKQKLRDAMTKRRQAAEMGIRLPTQQEKRAMAREKKKEPITTDSVNKLVEETPVTEQEGRVNNPTITRYESTPNKRHPLMFRTLHENLEKANR
jgi:hypothetical protein